MVCFYRNRVRNFTDEKIIFNISETVFFYLLINFYQVFSLYFKTYILTHLWHPETFKANNKSIR